METYKWPIWRNFRKGGWERMLLGFIPALRRLRDFDLVTCRCNYGHFPEDCRFGLRPHIVSRCMSETGDRPVWARNASPLTSLDPRWTYIEMSEL